MHIGQRIKTRRVQLGLSVDEVASLIEKNRATVYRFESRDIEKFDISVLEPLAKALQTSPAYLMGWTEQTNNSYNNNSYSNNNISIIKSTIEIPKSDLNPDETELVKMFRSLSIAGKARVITLIIQLLEEGISKET